MKSEDPESPPRRPHKRTASLESSPSLRNPSISALLPNEEVEDASPGKRMLAYIQSQQSRQYLEQAVITAVRSPIFFRMKGADSCIRTIYPKNDWYSPAIVTMMSSWMIPWTTPMGLGNDAIGLLNIGCTTGDDRLLLEGRKRHLATVSALRQELQKPDLAPEGVLATALNLLFCEVYRPVSSVADGENWTRHLAGLAGIMRGEYREQPSPHSASWLFMVYGQMDLILALVDRRLPLFGEQALKSRGKNTKPGSVDALLQLTGRLPALLHSADAVRVTQANDQTALVPIWHALLHLEESLFCWLTKFNPSKDLLRACASPHPITPSDLLPFSSYLEGMTMNFYWVAKLLTASCLHDLQPLLPPNLRPEPRTDFAAEADRFAALLCRSLASLEEYCGGCISRGLAARAPLHFAKKWYELSGRGERLEWCRKVERELKEEMVWVNWDALLPWSFAALLWLA